MLDHLSCRHGHIIGQLLRGWTDRLVPRMAVERLGIARCLELQHFEPDLAAARLDALKKDAANP